MPMTTYIRFSTCVEKGILPNVFVFISPMKRYLDKKSIYGAVSGNRCTKVKLTQKINTYQVLAISRRNAKTYVNFSQTNGI